VPAASDDDGAVMSEGETGWTAAGPALATPMRRLGGFLVDQAIFAVIGAIVLYRAGVGSSAGFGNPVYDRSALILYGMELAYSIVLIALLGQTVGSMVAGVRIIRQEDAAIPGWGPALRRVAVANLPALVPFIGLVFVLVCYGWMFRDPQRQGLHDKAAATLVIDARRG
jgi:uncharacterized RDD family membrane protein YckC